MDEQTPGTTPPQDQPEQQQQPSPPPPPVWTAPPPPPPYQPPPPTRRSYWWIPVSFSIGCLPWLLLVTIAFMGLVAAGAREPTGKHIAIIRVTGVITGGGSTSDIWGSSTAGSEEIIYQLERARKNKKAKAIVVRIDSPGGSAAASEEVWNEIMRVRKVKPVYTSMGDVAASGGYYIASACDRIFADYNTLTGSIGVIFSMADMSELFHKIGYKPEVLKSGKFKDIGSSARPLTSEERALLQGIIDNIYEKFLSSVAEGRGMKAAGIRPIADGRIFTGDQALKLKLVDEIGGLYETVRAAARRVSIKGEPKVVEYRRRGIFDILAGASSDVSSSRLQEEATRRMAEEILHRGHGIEGIK